MNIPKKTVPFIVVLLLVAAFFFGRYQGQNELLRGGQSVGQTLPAQTGGEIAGQQAGTQGQAPQGQEVVLNEEQWNSVISKVAAEKGSKDAPVTVVEFTDYQCPFCARYFADTMPQVEENYVDTGKVRYLTRDFPLPFHGNAQAAAQAARCAGDQGKYWEMHDALFDNQGEWSDVDPRESFVSYASTLGLDSNSFTDCLDSEKYKEAVEEDLALAQQLGVGGTPGFFINGKLLVGAQPFSAFQQTIDAEL